MVPRISDMVYVPDDLVCTPGPLTDTSRWAVFSADHCDPEIPYLTGPPLDKLNFAREGRG
jgi:hypothetical protein